MLIVGAQLLQAAQISLAGGDRGLLDLEAVLADRFGPRVATMFLVGFLATTFSSILGVWQGVSLLFADFVRNMRGTPAAGDRPDLETRPAVPLYVLWPTFPPMVLLTPDHPSALTIPNRPLSHLCLPLPALTPILPPHAR